MIAQLIAGGVGLAAIAGLILYARLKKAHADKYRHHMADALNELSGMRTHLYNEVNAHERTRKVMEFQDEIFRQMEGGELSIDQLSSIRSGVLPKDKDGSP